MGYWTGNLRDDAQPKQATITANSVNRTTRFFIPHPFSYLPAAAPPTCVPSGRGGGLCLVRSWALPRVRPGRREQRDLVGRQRPAVYRNLVYLPGEIIAALHCRDDDVVGGLVWPP